VLRVQDLSTVRENAIGGESITSVQCSRDGGLFCAAAGTNIIIFDTDLRVMLNFLSHDAWVGDVAWVSECQVLSGGRMYDEMTITTTAPSPVHPFELKLWDFASISGKGVGESHPILTTSGGPRSIVRSLSVSYDGSVVAVGIGGNDPPAVACYTLPSLTLISRTPLVVPFPNGDVIVSFHSSYPWLVVGTYDDSSKDVKDIQGTFSVFVFDII
jgi:hypothetical protein